MSSEADLPPGRWLDGDLPANVQLGLNTVAMGNLAFKRFRSRREAALRAGDHCTFDGVHFSLGEAASMRIGDYCYFTNAVFLSDLRIEVGSYVVIGWNATIADTDFHPVAPAERIADAIACSPEGAGRPRPKIVCEAVTIEDYAWIGPNATVLKGVRIGAGAIIEPGSLITKDVPPGVRMLGNPAQEVGRV